MKCSIEDISVSKSYSAAAVAKKPVFLTKTQREQLALQRREEEIEEQRRRQQLLFSHARFDASSDATTANNNNNNDNHHKPPSSKSIAATEIVKRRGRWTVGSVILVAFRLFNGWQKREDGKGKQSRGREELGTVLTHSLQWVTFVPN